MKLESMENQFKTVRPRRWHLAKNRQIKLSANLINLTGAGLALAAGAFLSKKKEDALYPALAYAAI